MREVLIAILLFVSGTATASVIRTFDGVTYEWLELSATANTSRYGINSAIRDENSELYGYEFASRQLVSDLFLSYTSWDGLEGTHGGAAVVSGIEQLFNDFGALFSSPGDGVDQSFTTVDGYTANYDDQYWLRAIYGARGECSDFNPDFSCQASVFLHYASNGEATMATQYAVTGWDPNGGHLVYAPSSRDDSMGAFLVRVTTVPVPAAAWLFASGLGLLGWMSRRA